MSDILPMFRDDNPSIHKVFELERHIKELPQVEFPLRHFFANGMYCREMLIPAGHVLTGHIHKHEHFAICTKGRLTIFDETGTHEVKAGDVFVSQPGIKRAGYAHEDTLFLNVLRMSNPEERDIKVLEDEFVVETISGYLEFLEQRQCLSLTA